MIDNDIYCEIGPSDFSSFDSSRLNLFTVFSAYKDYKFNYQKYFDMMIKSLFISNKNEKINFIIINNELSEPVIKEILYKYSNLIQNSEISIYLLKDKYFKVYSDKLTTDGWNESILYRLFICHLFKNISKILYLDVDTLIVSSLPKMIDKFNVDNYLFLGFKDIDDEAIVPYINSGVLIINLSKMRDKYKTPEDVIKRYIEINCSQDQIFINADETAIVNDIIYNFPMIYSRYTLLFSQNKLIRLKTASLARKAKIFHFYPKEDYKPFKGLFDIMRENSPIFKECFIEDTFD